MAGYYYGQLHCMLWKSEALEQAVSSVHRLRLNITIHLGAHPHKRVKICHGLRHKSYFLSP